MAANVWIRTRSGSLLRADQITGVHLIQIPEWGKGWLVVASTVPYGDVELARLGRGGRARTGAQHLRSRLPGTIAAAAQAPASAATVTFTRGRRKGMGDWSVTYESGPADSGPVVDPRRSHVGLHQVPAPAEDPAAQRRGRRRGA
jgi:hypothetical protein